MQNTRKLKPFRVKSLLAFVLVLGLLVLGSTVATGTAHAEPSKSIAAMQKYCKANMPDKIEKMVCTETNMKRIQSAIEDDCKDEKSKKSKDACIEKAVEGIIDKVADKKPKSRDDFDQALNSFLKNSDNVGGCTGPTCPATPTGQGKNCDNNHCDLVALYINPAIKLLSIVVGLVVAASLVFAGIQYTTSNGDPQKTSAAKSRITNTLLAFLAYAFMFAFLNFLVPGGLFN